MPQEMQMPHKRCLNENTRQPDAVRYRKLHENNMMPYLFWDEEVNEFYYNNARMMIKRGEM